MIIDIVLGVKLFRLIKKGQELTGSGILQEYQLVITVNFDIKNDINGLVNKQY